MFAKIFLGGGRLMGASLVAQQVKNLPARQETPVQFLGQEDPLRAVEQILHVTSPPNPGIKSHSLRKLFTCLYGNQL